MTTISLRPVVDGSAVEITLNPEGITTQITRFDANGNATVRVPAGTFPRSTVLTYIDFEAALGSPVIYTAGNASATITLTGELPMLVAPLRPAMSHIVDMVTEYDAGRPSLGTIHQGIDRTDPLVALGRLTMRSGSLRVWVPTAGRGRMIESTIDRSGVMLYKQIDHPGLDMYFTVTGSTLAPAQEGQGWILTLNYQEIARPTSPISENVWTFGDVATSYTSFANVTASYDDFEGLSLNDDARIL